MNRTDEIDEFQYTATDVIEAEPLDILRLWKITINPMITHTDTTVELYLTHDISATYESNIDTDGGREVELAQVPEEIRQEIADRLTVDAGTIREGGLDHETIEDGEC